MVPAPVPPALKTLFVSAEHPAARAPPPGGEDTTFTSRSKFPCDGLNRNGPPVKERRPPTTPPKNSALLAPMLFAYVELRLLTPKLVVERSIVKSPLIVVLGEIDAGKKVIAVTSTGPEKREP